ncbi:hypothetical protein J4558_13720 [Leptolyngbya sp. 15MV]|nr:hypothetical protein J4558_13720 [Leptolyngbya sp. 15MV]
MFGMAAPEHAVVVRDQRPVLEQGDRTGLGRAIYRQRAHSRAITRSGVAGQAFRRSGGATYDEEGLLRLLRLARIGCDRIFAAQMEAARG